MNSCEILHETIVRDVYDIMHGLKDFDEIEWLRNKNTVGSIAKRASNLTLVFPVLVSNSLSIQTAMMISKAIERKCAILMQILFASMQVSDSNDLRDYLDKFHRNIDLRGKLIDADDLLHIVSTSATEAGIEMNPDVLEVVKEDMKNLHFYIENDYNTTSLNEHVVRTNQYGETYISEARGGKTKNQQKIDNLKDELSKVRGQLDAERQAYKQSDSELRELRKQKGTTMKDFYNDSKNAADAYSNSLKQAELNKANELVPTTIFVSFISNAEKNPITTTGVVGIKAKMYPVDSADIIYRLSSKNQSRNWVAQLIRATTREISFFRDMVFAIDKTKLDAVYAAKDSNNAKMFRVLERRAKINKYLQLLKRNDASPITSLVISQDEVEMLKKYNAMDIEKPFIARGILESYNLMDIVIADEGLEVAKFLFDDDSGVYDTLTFDALEKEAKDSSYKKVVNLMNKVSR